MGIVPVRKLSYNARCSVEWEESGEKDQFRIRPKIRLKLNKTIHHTMRSSNHSICQNILLTKAIQLAKVGGNSTR